MDKPQAIFWNGDIDNYYLGHQFEEMFKSRVYDQFFKGRTDLVVMDIGANIGLFTYYASRFAKEIHSIEPSKDHLSSLSRMVEFNELTNKVIIHPYAVSSKDGMAEFHHSENKTMYSLSGAVNNTNQAELVVTKRLDTIFLDNKIEHVDFIKLDTEGAEFEILGSDSFANVAHKIDSLVVEAHQWAGRHPHQLVESLELRGFIVQRIPNDATLFAATRRK